MAITFGDPWASTGGYTITTSTSASLEDSLWATRPPQQCEFAGHQITEWADFDGALLGYCAQCHERVVARRIPGGVPFARLKSLVENLIDDPDGLALALEMNEVADLLDAEAEAIAEARALLATARRMAGCEI